MEPLPSMSYILKAHVSFSWEKEFFYLILNIFSWTSAVPEEVTWSANMNSRKSIVPLLSASKVRKMISENLKFALWSLLFCSSCATCRPFRPGRSCCTCQQTAPWSAPHRGSPPWIRRATPENYRQSNKIKLKWKTDCTRMCYQKKREYLLHLMSGSNTTRKIIYLPQSLPCFY